MKISYLIESKNSIKIVFISIINLLLILSFGTYLEDYDSNLASFVNGIYTTPATKVWDFDVHFILLSLYSYIAVYLPSINVFAIILLIFNLITLTLTGLFILNLLSFYLKNKSKVLFMFLLLYLLIAFDNIVNLNSTRIVFIGMATMLGYISFQQSINQKITKIRWFLISITIVFLSLIRMDAVLLSSIIFIFVLIIHKSFFKSSLIPLIIGLFFLIVFNTYTMNNISEARQAFYYKELDVFNRANLKTNLNDSNKLELEALIHFLTFDKEHFTIDFYEKNTKKKSNGYLNILNGLNKNSIINTIKNSIPYFKLSLLFILLAIFTSIPIYRFYKIKVFAFFTIISSIILPTLVCLYVVTPERFLIPYYLFLTTFNIFLLIKNKYNTSILFIIIITTLSFFTFINTYKKSLNYNLNRIKYQKNITKLTELSTKISNKNPIVINNVSSPNFFPISPFDKIPKTNALFLNFYYFNSFECYLDKWNSYCNCNALSLEEKINYIINKKSILLIDQDSFQFLKKYLKLKYNIDIKRKIIAKFDDKLDAVELLK